MMWNSGGLVVAALVWSVAAAAMDRPSFFDLLSGEELDLSPQPGEVLTEAVLKFHRTGHNAYRGDPASIEAGRGLYLSRCAFCHGLHGEGALGPPLTGPDWTYHSSASDPGMFSIIFSGAYGAMDSFSRRGLHQDQILKIIAYVRTFKANPESMLLMEADPGRDRAGERATR